jgi:hypothetical protein
MAVASLQYNVEVAAVGGAGAGSHNATVGGVMSMMNYGFETGTDVDGITILFDYSGFDQDTHEASVKTMLNAMCSSWAASLGVGLAVVQAGLTVNREWGFTGLTPIGGQYPSFTWTEQMPYP